MKNIGFLLKIISIMFFLVASPVCATTLTEEAEKAILDYYITNNKLYTICGSSIYSHLKNTNNNSDPPFEFIIETKDAHAITSPEEITHADTLNGIEWKGFGEIKGKSERMYTPNQGWSEWKPAQWRSPTFKVFKKEGKWIFNVIDYRFQFFQKIDCETVASMTK